MAREINCCYKCTKRKVGCHSICEEYKRDKLKWEELKKQREIARPTNEYIHDRSVKKFKKYVEKKG